MNNSIFNDLKKVFSTNNYLYQIIIVNTFVFIILNILLALTPSSFNQNVIRVLALPANAMDSLLLFWTYFTYMFTHTGLWHIASNMLWLYWMGIILVDLYGQKRVLQLYIYGGLAGGILYVLSSLVLPSVSPDGYLIGASGGVMSVMVAIGVLQPNYNLRLVIFGNVSLKYLVLFGFLFSTILDLNQNTGGKIAHFGGAAFGAVFAYYLPKGIDITRTFNNWFESIKNLFTRKPKIKVVHKSKNHPNTEATSKQDQAQVDIILDKISKSGYDSLTKSEKDFLFKFGK